MLILEPLFSLIYLIIIGTIFTRMAMQYRHQPITQHGANHWLLMGVLVLGMGDLFHLGARVFQTLTDFGSPSWRMASTLVGWGLFATSFTLTLFYLFALVYLWKKEGRVRGWLDWSIAAVLSARLLILFFPQNNWAGAATEWSLYRNVPFFIGGLGVALLFLRVAQSSPVAVRRWQASASWSMVASFVCYLGALLLADRYPLAYALMGVKSIAYIIITFSFYRLEFQNHETSCIHV